MLLVIFPFFYCFTCLIVRLPSTVELCLLAHVCFFPAPDDAWLCCRSFELLFAFPSRKCSSPIVRSECSSILSTS